MQCLAQEARRFGGASGIKPGQIVNDEVSGYSFIGVGDDGSGNSTDVDVFSEPTGVHYASFLLFA